ncbi:heme exporter protein CcmD [Parahaliea mediterranea]|uniref:Heme exporter protein D n=1 Tax=Parahaliea mediterranea TaxID=651086 RepID=A0A939IPE7_9GAMM|nr:heme exporter protein CcmD [Parahaliea mediterranea]MBN7798977.1 heme exporter protein CcmD [Parahaliea mediterranea]
MYFDSVHAALAMEGHGPFVWAAYVITLAVLAAMLTAPARRARRLRRELAGNFKRNAGRGGGANEVGNASGT